MNKIDVEQDLCFKENKQGYPIPKYLNRMYYSNNSSKQQKQNTLTSLNLNKICAVVVLYNNKKFQTNADTIMIKKI